ncbi:MAG: tetratricopeptide repeat protein [Chlamydiota bacterium]
MHLDYISGFYGNILFETFLEVQHLAQRSSWLARLCAIPLGAAIIVSLPVAKVFSFIEQVYRVIFRGDKEYKLLLKRGIEVVLGPLLSILIAIALISSLVVSPEAAAKKSCWTYFHHPATFPIGKKFSRWQRKRLCYARRVYEALLVEQPHNNRLYNHWGNVLDALGEKEEAADIFRKAGNDKQCCRDS